MKRKWLIILWTAVLCAVALLIWNGTAERRYVAAVRKLEWSQQWADGPGHHIWCDRMDYPGIRMLVADPEQQKMLFAALENLTYEGKYEKSFAFMSDEEGYQITFSGTEQGRVSVCLLANPAESYDHRPRSILQYGNEHIIVSGAEALIRAARQILGSQ